ncbi:MAG: DMT family transporter [Chloroflexi bacterium]|nr:DMT family transporter [Chloroflexota bacterium]
MSADPAAPPASDPTPALRTPIQPARRYANQGVAAALLSAALLGLTPIFGKQALRAGMDPFALVALRTVLAAGILWLVFSVFARRYLFIYPAGLIACAIAGIINGLGSLMFYIGLARLDASVAQLLFSINPLILVLLLRLDGQPISRLTAFRLVLALPAIYLLTSAGEHAGQLPGAALLFGSAFMYALHLAVTQRALRDMPSQTLTLYTVTAMALTVLPSALWIRTPLSQTAPVAWWGVAGLTLMTVLSRLSLFVGVKRLGGQQAALLGLSELVVSVAAAILLFGERLTLLQSVGALLLTISVMLVAREKELSVHHISEGWLAWVYGLFEKVTWPGNGG